jgi:hypothetical protein
MGSPAESIPLGNGEIGANVWVDRAGVHILLSRIDSFSEQYRLLKNGHILISADPNPFTAEIFTTLSLPDARLIISDRKTGAQLSLFADANYPVYSLEMNLPEPAMVRAVVLNYRKNARQAPADGSSSHMNACPVDRTESADITYINDLHSIGQYHRNESSCYDYTMKLQRLQAFPGYEDPFKGLTFGFLVYSPGLDARDSGLLETPEPVQILRIDLYSHCCRCVEKEKWLYEIQRIRDGHQREGALEKHTAYWHKKWEETYIYLWGNTEAEIISRAWTLQRYMNICAGRGALPIKFNGSIFTTEPVPGAEDGLEDFDFRQWGAPYWFQNTRLVYWNILLSGDYELMAPFFKMYVDMLPIAEYRTRVYFNHEGALIPETVTFFGTYTNTPAAEDPNYILTYCEGGWIGWYYQGMLELSTMMLLYWDRTGDRDFFRSSLVPFISSTLKFFRQHYRVIDGKLVVKPTSALESWQDCVNDAPTIAGIYAVAQGVLNLAPDPDPGETLKALCRELLDLLPPLPMEERPGGSVLRPFSLNIDEVRRNHENPELYAVFPYHLHTLLRGDVPLAQRTYAARDVKRLHGWAQDAIQAALLGMTDEAYEIILQRFSTKDPKCIFPVFWGPNYDYTPDQDHGSVAAVALILSLVQSGREGIKLLPAWNSKINAAFRLPLYGGGFVEAVYDGGTLSIKTLAGHTMDEILTTGC